MKAANGVPPGLARRLPRHICAAAHRIGRIEDLRDEAERLKITLPASLERAIDKRRREYLAGRISAARALSDLLGTAVAEGDAERLLTGRPEAIAVAADGDDVPLWPDGVVGSISHGAGFGFAAVAAADCYRGLGVDVERVVSADQALRLGPRVLTDRELDLRRGEHCCLTREEMFTLAFSAKESAYKALFPVHRRVLGFSDVELERRDGAKGTKRSGDLRLRATIDRDAGVAATLVGCYAITCDAGGTNGAAACRLWTLVMDGSDGGRP